MAALERIDVAPGILAWARTSAGYRDVETAAKKLGIQSDLLVSWEHGEKPPTVGQLRKMAKLYNRPLAVLLLPEPPADFMPLREFRLITGAHAGAWSPELQAEFRRAHTQREVLLEIADISPSSLLRSRSDFQIDRVIPAESAGSSLRQLLKINQWTKATFRDPRLALRTAVAAVEDLGISVMHTRNVSISEMRGFSISEWPYPVIALNGSDWPRPRLFSLLHEFAHLALNAGGICDLHEMSGRHHAQQDEIEQYCNEVAGAILMPATDMLSALSQAGSPRWTVDLLNDLAARFPASTEAFLIRLIGLGRASWDDYRRLKPELDELYEEARRREKIRQQAAEGGPSYYVVKARDLGHQYVVGVLDAFQARAISSSDVTDYLGVKFNQLPKLSEAAGA